MVNVITMKIKRLNLLHMGSQLIFKNEESFKKFLTDKNTHTVKNKLVNIVVRGYDGIFSFNLDNFWLSIFLTILSLMQKH
jgi:hypothetical protein